MAFYQTLLSAISSALVGYHQENTVSCLIQYLLKGFIASDVEHFSQAYYKIKCKFFYCYYGCSGYGGGYNEREGVEYIEREDSDDEFDEVLYNTCMQS